MSDKKPFIEKLSSAPVSHHKMVTHTIDLTARKVTRLSKFPIYGSEQSPCYASAKPISKMLFYEP